MANTVPSEPIFMDKQDNNQPMNDCVREFIRSRSINSVASRSIRSKEMKTFISLSEEMQSPAYEYTFENTTVIS